MKRKIITRANGKIKARIQDDGYGVDLLLMRNGYQWAGSGISPELARLAIEVLQIYLDGGLDNPNLLEDS